jgi:cell division protein FtsI (penicillin-binding protein 3)
MLADMLGPARMDAYLRRFGFGTKTGLGFPAESAGILLPTDQWEVPSTSMGSIPIGQGVSVTAMQMLEAINVLANSGTYVPPRLLRSITRADGTSEPVPTGASRRVVSAETAAAVRAMMAQVVERGTGQAAKVARYEVAGKTGTARKPQENGGYADEDGRMHYMATFVGLLPAERPDLSVIVVVDEPDPSRSIYASEVAAPAFADIARLALRRLSIPPSVGGSVSDVPELSPSAQDVGDVLTPGEVDPSSGDEDSDGGEEDGSTGGGGAVDVDRPRRDGDADG